MSVRISNVCSFDIHVAVTLSTDSFTMTHAMGGGGFGAAFTGGGASFDWERREQNIQTMTINPGNWFDFSIDYGDAGYVAIARSRPSSFSYLSKADLQTELRLAGMATSGNKQDLRDRLEDAGVRRGTYSWARTSRRTPKGTSLRVKQDIFKSPQAETDEF